MENKTSEDFGTSEKSTNISVEENVFIQTTEIADKTDDTKCKAVSNTDTSLDTSTNIDTEEGDVDYLPDQQTGTEVTEIQAPDNIIPGAVGGSEETFDAVCQACLEGEKHVEAFMYCVECDEYLCEHCVSMHRGVRLTKGHKLVSKQALNDTGSTIHMDKKEPCPSHSGEYLQWFCKTDFAFGCIVCKSTVHGKCKDVIALSEAVSSFLTDQKIDGQIKELEATKERIRSIISNSQVVQDNLVKDKCESLKELEKIKTDIEKAVVSLYELIRKDETKIEETYVEIKKSIENDVNKFVKIQNALDRSVLILKRKRLNDEYKFIHVVKAEENLKPILSTLSDFENVKSFPRIAYETDKTLHDKLKSIDKLGYFDQDKVVYSVTFQKEIEVAMESEKSCYITSVYLVNSRRLLIADWGNSSLKVIDVTDECVKNSYKLEHRPFDICRVEDDGCFAVTLLHGREVKFFITSDNSILNSSYSSIKTVEKCRGVMYKNSNLFVLCGGGMTDHEGPGHIRVYTLNGKLQNIIIQDGLCRKIINNPWRITIHPDTNMAFLIDGTKILQINLNTFEIETVIENLQPRPSLCFDPAGRIIIAGYEARSVELLDMNSRHREELLKPNDLKQRPRHCMYDPECSTLYVGFEDSKALKCFSMEVNQWDKAL